jgi:hypothetical protein
MFTYTLARAVERGFVPLTFLDAAIKGYQGVMQRISLTSEGLTNLIEISIGTSVGDLAYYLARPRKSNDLHGLGAFLLMYEQLARIPATSFLAWLEAEAMVVVPPFAIKSDPSASGGAFVQVLAGGNGTSSPPVSSTGRLSFSLPQSGKYKIWARVVAPNTNQDSIWLRVDGGSWLSWNNIAPGSGWHWDDVHSAKDKTRPLTFNLVAGPHIIDLAYREGGVRLDRLLVTNALSFVPSGTGG